MFALNEYTAALCGRYNVYVFPMSSSSPIMNVMALDLATNLPAGSKADPAKLSIVCCDISSNGQMVVFADSGKNVYVFEYIANGWELFASWEMSKRLVKVQFDKQFKYVIMTDKTGDIYVCLKGLKIYSRPKRILGHTSYVLDVAINSNSNKIISCDRDDKIRISSFPRAFEITGYKLGHNEAVVNIALVNRDANLISMSIEGVMKLWRFASPDTTPVMTSDIFTALGFEKDESNEVVRMRAGEADGRVYMTVQVNGWAELFVFEVKPIDKTMKLFGRIMLDHSFVDFCWSKKHLYVFSPQSGTVDRYIVSYHVGLSKDEAFVVPIVPSSADTKDFADFVTFNRPFQSLKKQVPTSSFSIKTLASTRKIILNEFGSLPELEVTADAPIQSNGFLPQLQVVDEPPQPKIDRKF